MIGQGARFTKGCGTKQGWVHNPSIYREIIVLLWWRNLFWDSKRRCVYKSRKQIHRNLSSQTVFPVDALFVGRAARWVLLERSQEGRTFGKKKRRCDPSRFNPCCWGSTDRVYKRWLKFSVFHARERSHQFQPTTPISVDVRLLLTGLEIPPIVHRLPRFGYAAPPNSCTV